MINPPHQPLEEKKGFLHGSAKNFLGTCQKFSVSLLLWKNSNYLQKLEYLSKCQNNKADCTNFCGLLRKAEVYTM